MADFNTFGNALLSIPVGRERAERLCIIGDPNYKRQFYDRLGDMGKLRYHGNTPMIGVGFDRSKRIVQEVAEARGGVAYAAFEIEVPRYGLHLFRRFHLIHVMVAGSKGVAAQTLRDAVEMIIYLQAKNSLEWIVDGVGRFHPMIPPDLDGAILAKRGTFRIRCSVSMSNLFGNIREAYDLPKQIVVPTTIIEASHKACGVTSNTAVESHASPVSYGSGLDSSADPGGVVRTPMVNPTTGFPMVDGPGGIDVGGNTWGAGGFQDVNPGSGLPTVAGPGSPDVAGNAWGTNHF